MKQLSTGTGLAVLGLSAITCVLLSNTKLGTPAQASSTPAVAAVTAAAIAQTEPTIVWYGAVHNNRFAYTSNGCNSGTCERSTPYTVLLRAWSNGTVEAKKICTGDDCGGGFGAGGWQVVSAANLGLNAWADLDFSEEVDAGDLAMVLLNYGDAPRQDIPPSDCPLNLINPR